MTSVVLPSETGTCLVLVDYDNAFPPNQSFTDEEIAHDVETWIRRLSGRFPDIARFEVRLYGGWYDDADLSRRGSEVAQKLSKMPEFPIRLPSGLFLRGGISLATGPLASASEAPLLNTYRRRSSLPRIRLSGQPYPESCVQASATCPAAILQSFTKTVHRACPADGCATRANEAFVVHEQKMVDTMLATDVLTASRLAPSGSVVAVVSGDSDFVPPLMAAHMLGGISLVQLVPRENESSEFASFTLASAGIDVM